MNAPLAKHHHEAPHQLRSAENLGVICDRISTGSSLTDVLREPGMPSRTAFFRWMQDDEAARDQYAHARNEQGHWYADRVAELALAEPQTGEHGIDQGEVAHRRLAIDSLKWLAAKRTPKAYGDAAASTTVNVGVQVGQVSEEQRAKAIARKKAAVQRRLARLQG